ncbi:Dihydroneopterin aldolase [bacterium HR17]|uniref:7,8-dihydroneopterin aldolase n=1 Tax=Candidatus Fervidibacter japonicus TaxID=2035412 RepID=A0A2H5XAQ6_9BACT|nr:Dihydroneopterin aldolase [bacterium HR17]
MDWLLVKGLTTLSKVGCLPVEQRVPQPIEVDIALQLDLRDAAQTDSIKRALDYRQVCEVVRELLERNSYKLLETAAYDIAQQLLERFPQVQRVRVEVRKPHPPIPVPLQWAGVQVELSRHAAS